MKLNKSIFVMVVALVSVSAYAGTARKPAGVDLIKTCGSPEAAAHFAQIHGHAAADHACDPKATACQIDGPAGENFPVYHCSVKCGGTELNYDVETHLLGLPGRLHCQATVEDAGQFAAHSHAGE